MRKIKFDKFNPNILIGYTFLGRVESSKIIDIDEVEPNNYKVKRKYFSGNLEKTTSFTKQELYDLYLGKKVDGDEIFATKMEKGGGISHYKVGNEIFIDYMDAVSYCDKKNLPYSKIIKTKKYEDGGSTYKWCYSIGGL
jgi:hypothetical protein